MERSEKGRQVEVEVLDRVVRGDEHRSDCGDVDDAVADADNHRELIRVKKVVKEEEEEEEEEEE